MNWWDTPCKLVTKNLIRGYPYLRPKGQKKISLTRTSLEAKLGRPIRDGYECCHHCDVKNCIEPEHLFEGTHAQNMRNAWRKGRFKSNWNV